MTPAPTQGAVSVQPANQDDVGPRSGDHGRPPPVAIVRLANTHPGGTREVPASLGFGRYGAAGPGKIGGISELGW